MTRWLLAFVLLAGSAAGARAQPACNDDSTCPYGCCRRANPKFPCYCSACCVGSDHPENRPRVFSAGGKLAAVGSHLVSFYDLHAGSSATVDGRPVDGPLALEGPLKLMPELAASKVLAFAAPIARPQDPQRNGERFLVCTQAGKTLPVPKGGFRRFCGVMDLSGHEVYAAPTPPKGSYVEALALSADGKEALFVFGHGKSDDRYSVWTQDREVKTLKADLKAPEVRETLKRFGLERSEGE